MLPADVEASRRTRIRERVAAIEQEHSIRCVELTFNGYPKMRWACVNGHEWPNSFGGFMQYTCRECTRQCRVCREDRPTHEMIRSGPNAQLMKTCVGCLQRMARKRRATAEHNVQERERLRPFRPTGLMDEMDVDVLARVVLLAAGRIHARNVVAIARLVCRKMEAAVTRHATETIRLDGVARRELLWFAGSYGAYGKRCPSKLGVPTLCSLTGEPYAVQATREAIRLVVRHPQGGAAVPPTQAGGADGAPHRLADGGQLGLQQDDGRVRHVHHA
jgi:hypothetical protein